MEYRSPRPRHVLGRYRLSATTTADPSEGLELTDAIRTALRTPTHGRSKEQKAAVAKYHRSVASLLRPVREQIAALHKEIRDLHIPTALVTKERASSGRLSTSLRIRGNFMNKGENIPADVPAALPPLGSDEPPNRLGLARWIVNPRNPLTARVAVNRSWEQIFGRGIVETSEDFGTRGSPPTHPELLDWLATELVRQGWSLKALHRLIVTSSTYRQSSAVTHALLERDPNNRFLARGPRFRLDGEAIRDVALAASGLLSRKIGGPSVFPPQPEGIWSIPFNPDRWKTSLGEDRYRRGLYTFWRRSSPYPAFMIFDAPSREFCSIRRPRTNTPLQALTTLNDPGMFEMAQGLARRIVVEAGPVRLTSPHAPRTRPSGTSVRKRA